MTKPLLTYQARFSPTAPSCTLGPHLMLVSWLLKYPSSGNWSPGKTFRKIQTLTQSVLESCIYVMWNSGPSQASLSPAQVSEDSSLRASTAMAVAAVWGEYWIQFTKFSCGRGSQVLLSSLFHWESL